VAIVDSGVHASHPHVGGVAGGVGFDAEGAAGPDFVDRLGHGTAVAAVIREKAPAAELWAVRVFEAELRTEPARLVAALDWAVAGRFPLVNLSLGTADPAHEPALRTRVEQALAAGVLVVTALRGEDGTTYLPGTLAGVLAVELDWSCPRHDVRPAVLPDGRLVVRASGYPRPIPGVPAERNLKGLSFAVANVTGTLARTLGGGAALTAEQAWDLLARAGGS
jgi:subtilisin family serine protease